METIIGVITLGLILCAGFGWIIGNEKQRGTEGLLAGLFLGVIGLIIAASLPPAKTFDERQAERKEREAERAAWVEKQQERQREYDAKYPNSVKVFWMSMLTAVGLVACMIFAIELINGNA